MLSLLQTYPAVYQIPLLWVVHFSSYNLSKINCEQNSYSFIYLFIVCLSWCLFYPPPSSSSVSQGLHFRFLPLRHRQTESSTRQDMNAAIPGSPSHLAHCCFLWTARSASPNWRGFLFWFVVVFLSLTLDQYEQPVCVYTACSVQLSKCAEGLTLVANVSSTKPLLLLVCVSLPLSVWPLLSGTGSFHHN